jgi:hypothetical protein
LLFGIALSVIPVALNLLFAYRATKTISVVAGEESIKLAHADMDHIVSGVYDMCLALNGLAQQRIDNALKTSRSILKDAGPVAFSKNEKASWEAINQFTKQATSLELPKMLVGGQWLGQNLDINAPSLVVDKTRDLSVETCTIFQRMNQVADMPRVATNVIKLDGSRAIGTFIPAINPNGSTNSVVSTILKRYLSRKGFCCKRMVFDCL